MKAAEKTTARTGATRLKATIRGAVQGVGFRPFVFRLAAELKLTGWVGNSAQGVFLEVEGERSDLEKFLLRLEARKPPHSFIQSLEASWLDPIGYIGFGIRMSNGSGDRTALVLPDIATCPDCLREIFDPGNRRHLYPFTNCTHCGPRFSIIERLPYDRENTSMKNFVMCPECQAEYDDPCNRRFHAQPNACPTCGPRVELRQNREGTILARDHDALQQAADAIRAGQIVAVKGIGGFHLMADASSEEAVQRLRERKQREEKPFAVMCPSLEIVEGICNVSPLEARLLRSSEAPIVLLRRNVERQSKQFQIARSVAPGNPCLGVMLPSNPLHHILMLLLGEPVVATSGNLSDEPICTDECEAIERLGGIADFFLVHNRPIVRHMDDSIVRIVADRELVLRRARGYAPLPIRMKLGEFVPKNTAILAVGGHLKSAVALALGGQVFISQHLGDLETNRSYEAFQRAILDLTNLYGANPSIIAADEHPDYLSTKFALDHHERRRLSANLRPVVRVQHHVAHALSCMAENEIEPPVLAVSFDGTGYGDSGAIWGGEFFRITDNGCERVAHLREFQLPGGELAVKEPRRAALGLLYELMGDNAFDESRSPAAREFSERELAALKTMLERKINSPRTSSAGRLFDAVAALIGVRQRLRFEGQAAMELEFAIGDNETDQTYPFAITAGEAASVFVIDWSPVVEAILADVSDHVPVAQISAKFHNTLAECIVAAAEQFREERVVLSGGCFQNRYLTERVVSRLQAENFRCYWHQRVPPNDGGIALGQVVAAMRKRNR